MLHTLNLPPVLPALVVHKLPHLPVPGLILQSLLLHPAHGPYHLLPLLVIPLVEARLSLHPDVQFVQFVLLLVLRHAILGVCGFELGLQFLNHLLQGLLVLG